MRKCPRTPEEANRLLAPDTIKPLFRTYRATGKLPRNKLQAHFIRFLAVFRDLILTEEEMGRWADGPDRRVTRKFRGRLGEPLLDLVGEEKKYGVNVGLPTIEAMTQIRERRRAGR